MDEFFFSCAKDVLKAASPLKEVKPLAITTFGGFDNYLLLTEREQFLLKLTRDQAIAEVKFRNLMTALQLVAAWNIPASELIGFGEWQASRRYYVLIRYHPGEDAQDALPNFTPQERARFFFELGRVTAQLHHIPVDHYSDLIGDNSYRPAYHKIINEKLDRLAVYSAQLTHSAYPLLSLIERLREKFTTFSIPFQPAVVHGDLTTRNILVHNRRFDRLLDFENTKFYDPLYDFAKLHIKVFNPAMNDKISFTAGYTEIAPIPANSAERIHWYIGLDLIQGYSHRLYLQDNQRASEYAAQLKKWLVEDAHC